MNVLNKHINEIKRLCINHNVKELYAFGSVLTNKFNNESDIDLLVNFEPIEVTLYTDNYYDLKYSLQKLLNRQVDLLEDKTIKNPYFRQSINLQRQIIYGH